MPETAPARGRILDPLQLLLESLQHLHRDLAAFVDIERIRQFDGEVSQFILSVKKAQQLTIAGLPSTVC